MANRRRRLAGNAVILTGLVAILGTLAGCGEKAQPVTSETTKFRPADESAPAAGDVAQASPFPGPANGLPEGAPAGTAQGGDFRAPASYSSGNSAAAPTNGQAADGKSPNPDGKSTPPSGELQKLLRDIDRLSQEKPQGKTQQEMLENFVRNQQERLALGKRALALNPDKETRQRVFQAMYEVHRFFVDQLRAPGAREQLAAFTQSLLTDADPDIQRMGRHTVFEANVSRIANEQAGDGKDILAELKKLLDAEKGDLHKLTLDLADQGVNALMELGLKEDAIAGQEMVTAAVTADPKLADQAGTYADRAKLMKSDLSSLLESLLKKEAGAEQKLMTAVEALLADVKLSAEMFSNMQRVAQLLEVTGNYTSAQKTYDLLEASAKTATDERVVKAAVSSAELARKRLALVGQPFAVEGVTLDGKPFDWSAYAGKVVLLDFWATWCGPCIEELPNIRRNFEQFHTKGFDVVGINVDHEINKVKQFLSFQELPWVTVTSQDALDGKASEDFSQHPMPAKCGIDAIPFVALIGKDGKVDSIHVRGPRLESRLIELLGPPATAEVPADPTQPGAPALRPATGDRGSLEVRPGVASPVALLMAQALLAAPPAPEIADEAAINPYRAKAGLKTGELVAYVEKMLDKPLSIQQRDGFAAGLVEACDRILAADPPAKAPELLLAAKTKLALLHREACEGKSAADEQLGAFVEKLKDDPRPSIAREVAFLRLEQKVRGAADLPLAEIPTLLVEVQEFAAKEKLTAKHLRLASSTVAAINRLESGDEREKQLAIFGALFAKSSEPVLARYGKQLVRGGAKGIDPAAAVAVPH